MLRKLNLKGDFVVDWFNHALSGKMRFSRDLSVGRGCDILIKPMNLAIEVKLSSTDRDFEFVTGNELKAMKRYGNRYFLVLVANLYSGIKTPVIKVVKNPYQKILSG